METYITSSADGDSAAGCGFGSGFGVFFLVKTGGCVILVVVVLGGLVTFFVFDAVVYNNKIRRTSKKGI